MEKQKNQENDVSSVEFLFSLSHALKNGVDGGFVSREHASSIFKKELKKAGFEITKKEGKEV